MEMETVGIAVGAGSLGAILSFLGNLVPAWLKQKRTIEPQPLAVDKQRTYITTSECNRRMCEVQSQIETIRNETHSSTVSLLSKLDELDQRAEARAIDLNRRVDPLIAKVAATDATLDMLKTAARNATIGGKK